MLRFSIHNDLGDALEQTILRASSKAEETLTQQVARDTEDFVPMLTGSLKNRTIVDGNLIVYPGPYARYLYYGKKMVDAATGKGPMKIIGDDGVPVWRFRKGATLKVKYGAGNELKFTKTHHKNAQAFWFDASKAQNLDKWLRISERMMKDAL